MHGMWIIISIKIEIVAKEEKGIRRNYHDLGLLENPNYFSKETLSVKLSLI